MQSSTDHRHVYQRSIDGSSNDSLSLISEMVSAGDVLLDLGVGSGSLGKFLSQQKSVVADGVTFNPDEQAIAAQWYRQTVVLDLDDADLATVFQPGSYDCIVCADVLEHLKNPQRILESCRQLLKPHGRILVSVPNAGYCGLVAELMQGEFRYRTEGLLDNTHSRFFTRKSLKRFVRDSGFEIAAFRVTRRSLSESEFRVPFDNFPPSVANYLLAMPDALTYQFICELRDKDQQLERNTNASPLDGDGDENERSSADAIFSAAIYLAVNGEYQEKNKIVCAGRIGAIHQTLIFDIPQSTKPYTNIRLDPADRQGFLRLHSMRMRLSDGAVLWEWVADTDSTATLSEADSGNLFMLGNSQLFSGSAIVLTGNDPRFVLPFANDLLQKVSAHGGRFELTVGWPMSADYAHAQHIVSQQKIEHQREQSAWKEQIFKTESAWKEQVSKTESVWKEQLCKAENDYLALEASYVSIRAKLKESLSAKSQVFLERSKIAQELRAMQRENTNHLNNFNQISTHLNSIEKSRLFRYTRPLVHMKMKFDQMFRTRVAPQQTSQTDSFSQVQPRPNYPVDIIVPVYRGLLDTQRCLESVLSAECETNWRLIVINDYSPEPEVSDWLNTFAKRDPRIVLVENSENKGFVASVNLGMALSTDNDVVLLNSDTEVANDWLDRLRRAAYSDRRVASVTPFSNNATICSYPGFCQANELPAGNDTASLDNLFARYMAGQTIEVPTGVGFCMYVTRASLDEVGLFDEDSFGKGYGEENDFCVRAQNAGLKNLHALDTFVRHAGGISFGDSKSDRELQAMETLRRLHPRYEPQVHAFVQQDPAAPARFVIDLARIVGQSRPVVLNVIHNRDGGTLRHVRDLAAFLGDRAVFLNLTPVPGGVTVKLAGEHEKFALYFALPQDYAAMLDALRALRVAHIHFHHLLGHTPGIVKLPEELGVTHDFTAHDYYSFCPQISLTDHTDRYCGEKGLDQCRQCLKRGPAPNGETIEVWRGHHAPLLNRARYVIAPSVDTARRLRNFVPGANLQVVPHSDIADKPLVHGEPVVRPLGTDKPIRVVVLGALSKIKGADLLEAVAQLAAKQNAPVEFHLLGYAYRNLKTLPKARLTVHGPYEDKDLRQLLDWLSPDVVWFPAQWPETYSYTLSASLESCLPIVAPNIGAFSERLHARPWTWQLDWAMPAKDVLDFFVGIRLQHFNSGVGPGPVASQVLQFGETFGILHYRGSYIEDHGRSEPVSGEELSTVRDLLIRHASGQSKAASEPTSAKLSALNAIKRLRATPLLSHLAKLVPLHMQRRVKSWLNK
jgi:GT2 family glycosyltransferase/2-polyprenyl-3-methyl-5-hydroxy-6-metoxy-1,4-benzoquinol methylase/glycosyltransferase involved in cell wall biosynthesis